MKFRLIGLVEVRVRVRWIIILGEVLVDRVS